MLDQAMAAQPGQPIPVQPQTKSARKFPDHFFEAHREKFARLINQWYAPQNRFLTIILRENYGYYMTRGVEHVVNFVVVEDSAGRLHVVPASESDLQAALDWEIRNKGVKENEFAN